MKIFGREPAFWIGLVMSLVTLAISLGVQLSTEQVDSIKVIVTALFSLVPLITGLTIRTQVVEVDKAKAQIQIGINSPTGTRVEEVIKKEERLNAEKNDQT